MNARVVVSAAYIAVAFAVLGFALLRGGGSPIMLVVAIAVCAVPLLLYLLMHAPRLFVALPGLVLGFMPFAAAPGTGAPLVVVLMALIIPVAALHPNRMPRPLGPLGVTVLAFLVISAVSMLANYNGFEAFWEYAKWAIATGSALVALTMDDALRRTLMRAFAASAAAGAAVTAVMLNLDPQGKWVNSFSFLGYGGTQAVNSRTAVVGTQEVLRASGLYVDPNSAGLVFVMAAGVGGAVFLGVTRLVVLAALATGVVATLSRSAVLTMIVAFLAFILIARLDAGRRLLFAALGVVALTAVLFIPAVSSRLFDSFGGRDVGASARADALANYPSQMEGAWLFGHGWYLREFWDPVYGFHVNYAANTPLVTIYRGGILVGAAFVVLLVLALIIAVRTMRHSPNTAAVTGGMVISLTLVAFQLDFPVVTMPPLAMCFGLLIAQLQVLDRDAAADAPAAPAAELPALTAKGAMA